MVGTTEPSAAGRYGTLRDWPSAVALVDTATYLHGAPRHAVLVTWHSRGTHLDTIHSR